MLGGKARKHASSGRVFVVFFGGGKLINSADFGLVTYLCPGEESPLLCAANLQHPH